jgi:uncharacterized membrane protein
MGQRDTEGWHLSSPKKERQPPSEEVPLTYGDEDGAETSSAKPDGGVPRDDARSESSSAAEETSPTQAEPDERGLAGHSQSSLDGSSDSRQPAKSVDKVAQDLAEILLRVVRTEHSVSQLWQGPMPDPNTLHHYEQIVPGAADRILKMAEANTTERAEVDRNLANAEIESARTGLRFAFALASNACTMT